MLNHGLKAALDSLASRASVPTTVSFESPGAPARAGGARGVLRRLRGAGQRRQVRPGDARRRCGSRAATAWRSIEIADDGVGGADETAGTGLQGLADRVAALDGTLRILSPPGAGTVVTAELPCAS